MASSPAQLLGWLSGSVGAVRAAVKTTRGVLAMLAGSSLLLRGVSLDVELADVLAAIRWLGFGLEWLLFVALVYLFFPRFLPDDPPAGVVVRARWFRLVVTVVVFVVALPLADATPTLFAPAMLPGPGLAGSTLVLAFLSWIGLAWLVLAVLVGQRWWNAASADERTAFVLQFRPRSATDAERRRVREAYERDDWMGSVSRAFGVVGATAIVVLICFFLGLAVGVASMLAPLPQAVVLGGLAVGVVGERVPERRGGRWLLGIRDRAESPETRLYLVLQYVLASRKGTMAAPFVVCSLLVVFPLVFVSLFGPLVAGVLLFLHPGELLRAVGASPLGAWNALGILVCLSIPGLYGLWYWLRLVARLPHYLAYWEETTPGDAAITDADLPPLVARPPDYLLVPTGALLLFAGVASFGGGELPLLWGVLFAIAWPIVAVAVALSVAWTVRRDDRPATRGFQLPKADGRALPAAFLVQLGWLWLLSTDRVLGDGIPAIGAGEIAVIAAFGVALYYVPDAEIELERRVDADVPSVALSSILFGGFFVVLGAIAAVIITPAPGLLAIAGGLLVGGLGGLAYVLDRLDEGSRERRS